MTIRACRRRLPCVILRRQEDRRRHLVNRRKIRRYSIRKGTYDIPAKDADAKKIEMLGRDEVSDVGMRTGFILNAPQLQLLPWVK